MITMSKFLRDVTLRVAGADETLISHEIEATIHELCEEGWAWPVTLQLDLRPGKDMYYLEPLPEQVRIAVVHRVVFCAKDITPRNLKPGYNVVLNTIGDDADPKAYRMEEPGVMRIMPASAKHYDKGLQVDLTVIPDCWNTLLPDYFWTTHRNAVIHGAMARLLSISGRPWSSPQTGAYHGSKFRNYVKRSRQVVGKRWSKAADSWQFPYYAGGSPYNGRYSTIPEV